MWLRTRGSGVVEPSQEIYDGSVGGWWDVDGVLLGMRTLLNPVRVPYFAAAIAAGAGGDRGRAVLDVGSGGGFLAEALAAEGLTVVGLDRSFPSVHEARRHAASAGIRVGYVGGVGERLPFADGAFDAVVCAEVLEHVNDPARVIGECFRVLRVGGTFAYAGPNRTVRSRLALIHAAQGWMRLLPPDTHRWDRFITPDEMDGYLRDARLRPVHRTGVRLRLRDLPAAAVAIVGLLSRRLSYADAGRRIRFTVGPDTGIAYQGFARKA
jgi:2-polyprenyl-6-hydroxyphenyl methylase/3-demethylubiquinone-9 3-methyltransferase